MRHYDKTQISRCPQVRNTQEHMHRLHNQFPLVHKIGHFLPNLMMRQKNRLHTEDPEKKGVDSEGGVFMIFPLALPALGNAGVQNKVKCCSHQRGTSEAVTCVLSHLSWQETYSLSTSSLAGLEKSHLQRNSANTSASHSQVVLAMSDQISVNNWAHCDYQRQKFQHVPTNEDIYWLSTTVVFH